MHGRTPITACLPVRYDSPAAYTNPPEVECPCPPTQCYFLCSGVLSRLCAFWWCFHKRASYTHASPASPPPRLSTSNFFVFGSRQVLPEDVKVGLGKARTFFKPVKVPSAVQVTTLADRVAAVLGLEVRCSPAFA